MGTLVAMVKADGGAPHWGGAFDHAGCEMRRRLAPSCHADGYSCRTVRDGRYSDYKTPCTRGHRKVVWYGGP